MKNKVYHSKELNQHFRFTPEGIVFEDKVTYTNEEIQLIKNSDYDIKIIHDAKLRFGGKILNEGELKQLTAEYNKGPSRFDMAVEFAADLIRGGTEGHTAISRASSTYNISTSAIGQELGKRRKSK